MLHQLRESAKTLHQILAESHRMRGGKADAIKSIDVMKSLNELHKRTLAADFRELMTPVEIHNLSKQGGFSSAPIDKRSCLGYDFSNRTPPFFSPGGGNDAEGAVHIAPLHDRNEGGRLFLLLGKMITDRILRADFGSGIDNRNKRSRGMKSHAEFGNILLGKGLLTFQDRLFDIVGHTMEFLGSHDKINVWRCLFKLHSETLGHAAHVAKNELGLLTA